MKQLNIKRASQAYAPLEETGYISLGAATKRRWPGGVPAADMCVRRDDMMGHLLFMPLYSVFLKSQVILEFKTYAGDLWARVKSDFEPDELENEQEVSK